MDEETPAKDSFEVYSESAAEPESKIVKMQSEPAVEIPFVCGSGIYAYFACAKEPFYKEHEGKDYCVLHYPGKEKREDFNRALEKKVVAQDFNFQGVLFPEELSFSTFRFNSAANFSGARFTERTNFAKVIFEDKADFSRCVFDAGADFSQATFNGDADFSGSRFCKEANFFQTTFKKDLRIYGTLFDQEADFINCIFTNLATFKESVFKSESVFSNAKFRGYANFSEVKFNAHAYFYRTHFSEKVNLAEAIFTAKADFEESVFEAPVYCRDVSFETGVSFSKANFKRDADFSEVQFKAEADFSSISFEGNVNFYEATFKDFVRFSGNPNAFDYFAKSANFQHAKVEKPERVYFQSAILRIHWFIDIDVRKFDFTNVILRFNAKREIQALREKGIPNQSVLLEKAFQRFATNFEDNQYYSGASELRYWASNIRRIEKERRFVFWKLAWWYWAASGYGERIFRAFAWILAIWIVFALFYTQVGFKPEIKDDNQLQTDTISIPLSTKRAIIYSLAVMSLQKPEPRPLTDTAQTLVLLETILGPVQAALLALAIRRKFMR